MNEEDLAQRLGSLPREAGPARDLWPGIEARLAPGHTAPARRSPLLRLAAVLLIFLSGVAVGHLWARLSGTSAGTSAAATTPAPRHSLQAAEEVQRAGSEYVAALAALRGEPRSEVRTQGREAAFSTLYGAAHELSRLSPGDPAARQILTTASRARHREERP